MNIADFNKLKKYENYLYTAHHSNFIRSMTMTQVNELIAVGKNNDIIYKHAHCPACLLKFVKQLADKYYAQKVKNENNKKKKDEQK